MKKRVLLGAVLGIGVLVTVVFLSKVAPYYFSLYIVPPSPQAYVGQALARMDGYGLYATDREWGRMREWALNACQDCATYSDTYSIIERALTVAGGKHSFLQSAAEKHAEQSLEKPSFALEGRIAFIRLPAFSGTGDAAVQYAESVQRFFHDSKSNIDGVMLDLRGNTGGDLGPMLSAVASLLPDGELLVYSYRAMEQAVVLNEGVLANAGSGEYGAYLDEKLHVPVALLVDGETASSAEALLLCFDGLENVRSFGSEATAGYTSVNRIYALYDGAQMALTVAAMQTRDGVVYENTPIMPNALTATPEDAASAWLQSMVKTSQE